ncbi:MAG TPA: GGDEF domain-containing protein [Steroidobacteraceae bacterium]|nr:GGDEF domain-containing protein [Steroidobacteraceae bacterium]
MDASPLLIECVAATTNCRDRDDIELSLVQLLLQFLAADSVTLFKLRHEAGAPRATHCLAASTGADGGIEITRGRGTVHSLATRELWRECIRSGEPQIGTPAHGGCEILLPLHSERGHVAGLLEILGPRTPEPRDLLLISGVLRIVRNHLELIEYGERDTLTGLLNRKTFESQFDKLRRELASNARTGAEGCWIGVVDIDHFKAVNDRYGHVIGDEVLLLVSQIIQRSFRGEDRVYRFGGEEFVILLCDTPEVATAGAMERLRAAVQAHRFPQLGTVTVSIGWTRIRPHDAPATAISRADSALYFAKDKGRNRVFQHERLLAEGELTGSSPGLRHEIELF